jgi:hypothetical protein
MNKQAVHSFSYITAEASRATQVIYQLLLFLKANQKIKRAFYSSPIGTSALGMSLVFNTSRFGSLPLVG